MDEQEKIERRAHIRLIITEALMVLAVVFLVGFLTLIVMGYSFNLRELVGTGEVVERTGLVQISSVPTGATIYIDGEAPLLLSTNASRTMLAGEHEISLAKGGFDGWNKKITVTEGMMYRLNYPRIFKEEREPEEVVRFYKPYNVEDTLHKIDEGETVKTYAGEISFVTVSPNNDRMVLVLDGLFYMLNLNDNKPELNWLEVPGKDGLSVVKITTIESAEWSGNSERLLARVNGEWAIINVRDTKDTLWLDGLINVETLSDMKFESEVGDRLLVLDKTGDLTELNARDKKLSEVLISGVERFDNDGDRIVYLTKEVESSAVDKLTEEQPKVDVEWQVRAYRVGENESYIVKRFELTGDEELGSVRLATMRYFQESYIGISRKDVFNVYSKTGWINGDESAEKILDEKIGFVVKKLKKRGKGMVFELSDGDKSTKVFDIEAMELTDVDVKNSGWIDEYLRFRLEDGKLSVLDYDGLNERVLVESGVSANRGVVIYGNSRWLYYFSRISNNENTDNREVLIREKIN